MSYKTVNEFLSEHGYKVYMCSADRWMFSFVQEENFAVNVICFFDERSASMGMAQMEALINVQKERLSYGRDKDIHILKIITADSAYIRWREEACPEDEWFYDSEEGRLYVPASSPEDFYGLRYPLDGFLREQRGLFLEPPEDSKEELARNADDIEKVPARDGVPVKRKIDAVRKASLPLLTFFLISVNVLFFFGQSSGAFDDESLMVTNDILSQPGQWYRLFTYSLIHISLEHLASNMLMLYATGSLIEDKLGRKLYAIIYLLSGLFAGIMSVWNHTRMGIPYYGLGASGAVYGIVGCMIAYTVISGIDRGEMKGVLIRIVFAMILFFYVGSGTEDDIDYMAHMGGFICGFFGTGIWLLGRSLLGSRITKNSDKNSPDIKR
ncbi:MAG: rhomboid family intramembrane serine protease [Lachnospiraceae bacterium]|nr:rhomboid family intramembrane serine protease [Lachnospiraceae bacterium]